jgi:mono/diheme cytochrome c family protein
MNRIFSIIIVLSILCLYSFVSINQIDKSSFERGKKVYQSVCLTCHQADGGGAPRMNPPLIKTKWVLGDKTALIKIVLKGLKGGEIDIDGDHFHNIMPPQEKVLTDQQIADVLTFVRNSFGNKASTVSIGEVKAVRLKLK